MIACGVQALIRSGTFLLFWLLRCARRAQRNNQENRCFTLFFAPFRRKEQRETAIFMIRYITQRLLHAIPVLFGVSLITFLLTYMLPADPARMYAGPNASVETVNSIRHQLGLDRPFYEQYFGYVGRVLTGDLGFSYKLQMPVGDAILSRFPYTLQLTAAGIFFELLLGLPIGLIAVLRPHSWLARLSMLFVFFAVA